MSTVGSADRVGLGGNTTNGNGAHAQFQIYALGTEGPLRWRLLGGNHRDLGRGLLDYEDDESCRLAIKQLLAGLDDLTRVVARDGHSGWTWRMVDNDDAIVGSPRAFDRRIRCVQACALFLDLAPGADLREGVLMSSWRASAGTS
jgi:hypothetical protein